MCKCVEGWGELKPAPKHLLHLYLFFSSLLLSTSFSLQFLKSTDCWFGWQTRWRVCRDVTSIIILFTCTQHMYVVPTPVTCSR